MDYVLPCVRHACRIRGRFLWPWFTWKLEWNAITTTGTVRICFFLRNGCAQYTASNESIETFSRIIINIIMNRPRKLWGGSSGIVAFGVSIDFLSVCRTDNELFATLGFHGRKLPSLLLMLSIRSGMSPNSILQYLFIIFHLNIRIVAGKKFLSFFFEHLLTQKIVGYGWQENEKRKKLSAFYCVLRCVFNVMLWLNHLQPTVY